MGLAGVGQRLSGRLGGFVGDWILWSPQKMANRPRLESLAVLPIRMSGGGDLPSRFAAPA